MQGLRKGGMARDLMARVWQPSLLLLTVLLCSRDSSYRYRYLARPMPPLSPLRCSCSPTGGHQAAVACGGAAIPRGKGQWAHGQWQWALSRACRVARQVLSSNLPIDPRRSAGAEESAPERATYRYPPSDAPSTHACDKEVDPQRFLSSPPSLYQRLPVLIPLPCRPASNMLRCAEHV